MEILILHPGALGDTILALPAIQRLRESLPGARLTLAGHLDHLDSIVSGYVEAVRSLAAIPLHRLYVPGGPAGADVQFWKSYDRVIAWTGAADADFCRNLKALHPEACIAAWKPAPGDPRHVAQIFLDSLAPVVSGDRKLRAIRIEPGAAVRDEGRRWLTDHGWNGMDSLAAMHPGAGGEWKRWPLVRFIELARRMVMENGRSLVIFEGPAEEGMAQHFASALPGSGLILSQGAGLRLLAGILAHCGWFCGNDSGIAHLAAALGLPCTVMFGPTLPQHWAPLGSQVTVLRDPGDCIGCASGGRKHTCLENITVDRVLDSCRQAPS